MPATNPDDRAPVTAEDVLEDLRAVVRDAEALLRATEGRAGDKADEIRARVEGALGNARDQLREAGADATERARTTARSADAYVHENPWLAIGVAAGVGFLLGLAGRRR